MSRTLKEFDPESNDSETRALSCLAKRCWSYYSIVYDPLKAGSIDGTDSLPHDKAIVRAQNSNYKPDPKIKGRPECTIFVSGLSRKTTEKDLLETFSRYGEIIRCRLVEDIVTGRSKGYGFIEFSKEREALDSCRKAFKTKLQGANIFVDMSCSKTLPGWVPRRLGGGFNGRKESGQLRFGGKLRPFKKPLQFLTEKEIFAQFGEKFERRDKEIKVKAERNDIDST